jgi:AcrR family transcriptional regulator
MTPRKKTAAAASGEADKTSYNRKRRDIAKAAAKVFYKKGYLQTNVDQIAAAAGLRKPSLYHYFKSKTEILYAIHEEFIDVLIEKQKTRDDSQLTVRESLTQDMADTLGLLDSHYGHHRVFYENFDELPRNQRNIILAKNRDYYAAIEEKIEHGIANGEIRDLPPRMIALAMFGACSWAYQWYHPGGAMTTREIAEMFASIFFDGIGRSAG